jgi:hypothetical protein
MKEFFAKIVVLSSTPKRKTQTVLKIFADNEEAAKKNLDRIIQRWENVTSYTLLKIGLNPISLEKYLVETEIKYRYGTSRTLNIVAMAENELDAFDFCQNMIKEWDQILSFEIKNIEKQF